MKKQLQYFILSVLAFGLFSAATDAQTKRLTPVKQKTATTAKFQGVYAGIETRYDFNGMPNKVCRLG